MCRRAFNSLVDQSCEEDSLVGETLKRTGVLLSLNKKQRWRVPPLINHMISNGSFDKKNMISMLERHKLKRRANCVRFASNGSRLPNVAPKQKKYFSLSLDAIDEDQSNREKRRLKVEEMKKNRLNGASEGTLKRKSRFSNTINTFTREGGVNATGTHVLNSSKDEYRLEVFYPCPQSCSLTFNPKYTDVALEEGKTGTLEVKANVKQSKRNGQKHRRNRHHTVDIGSFYFDAWANENDYIDDLSDCECNAEDEEIAPQSKSEPEENFLEILIKKAEQAHKLLERPKYFVDKKIRNVQNNDFIPEKSHIFYIDNEKQVEAADNVIQVKDHINQFHQPKYLQETKSLEFAKVILPSNETTREFLNDKYGGMYYEASSQPRRFMINITDDVANLLSPSKATAPDFKFTSYLVFIYDGIYDDGYDVYRVILNSQSYNSNCHRLSDVIDFNPSSLDETMNTVFGYLLDLNERNELKYHTSHINIDRKQLNLNSILHDRLNLTVTSFDPSHALSCGDDAYLNNEKEVIGLEDQLNCLSASFDDDIFCDICYDTINQSKLDAVYGTKLTCGHHCCDTCWALHFQSRIRYGATCIKCPGYDCKNEVGLVTLLSIVNVSDIALLCQRKMEQEVEISENSKWCPNPDCGRVIKVDSKKDQFCLDVKCMCGQEICFACLGQVHWPALCDQAEEYLDKLDTIQLPKESIEEKYATSSAPASNSKPKKKKLEIFEVEGRLCPACHRFIDKNGGCNNVYCSCGFQFCWNCCKASHFYSSCKVDSNLLNKHTRLVRIHHQFRKREDDAPNKSSHSKITERAKQKATLYQRAYQQRLEAVSSKEPKKQTRSLAKKIALATLKDSEFRQEVNSISII